MKMASSVGVMNQLKVSIQRSIVALVARSWSQRRISRELKLDRETVARYVKLEAAKPVTNPAIGSGEEVKSKPASNLALGSCADEAAKPATDVTHGSRPGPPSLCAPFEAQIKAALEVGLSAQRIYQDLVCEHGFQGAYGSVKRFVRLRTQTHELPFRRMECAPGDELQIDFGSGAWVKEDDRRRRRPHLFRAVLSYSRKGYSEVAWRQNTETVIRCLENAFRHFGGVTATLVPDNMKAAVLQPDWFDPELNPKLRAFCEHYGTTLLPTKPAMPRHKGKVEAGVKYAQSNALKGREFPSLHAQKIFLSDWERTVADTRLHGTIRQQVGSFFTQAEQAKLRPLAASLFPCFEEAPRKVHRDGHVAFRQAYYSVPPEYVGCDVWVRAETRLVRLYSQRFAPIAVHVRAEPGRFATDDAHIHSHKRTIVERGAAYMLERCRLLGAQSGAWSEGLMTQRGPEALRALQGLLVLARDHPIADLERACGRAVHLGLWRLRDIRRLLQCAEQVVQIDFLQAHPLIRDLHHYQLNP
jgi:transposase